MGGALQTLWWHAHLHRCFGDFVVTHDQMIGRKKDGWIAVGLHLLTNLQLAMVLERAGDQNIQNASVAFVRGASEDTSAYLWV